MAGLSDAELLELFERGHGLSQPWRAALLAQRSAPDMAWDAVLSLPVGRRDALVGELRVETWGARFTLETRCLRCDEPLGIDMHWGELRSAYGLDSPLPAPLLLDVGQARVEVRVPDTRDQLAVLECHSASDARQCLLSRCIRIHDGAVLAHTEPSLALQEGLEDAVSKAIEDADPGAVLRLELECESCGHTRLLPFDITHYVWREVELEARRLLDEIHALASVYGWRVSDVLALSPWMRRQFLERVGT